MDCELLSKVYINLLDQKEPMFELKIDKPVSKSMKRIFKINIIRR